MSNRESDNVLRELSLLAALDSVKAKIDTSAIAEIQDWSGAVVGKFYGASVEQELPTASRPSKSFSVASPTTDVSVLNNATSIAHADMNYAKATVAELIPICLSTNDDAAWTEFVHRYVPLITATIIKVARKMGRFSAELVNDLVQEVFIKLCANEFRVLKSFELRHENAFAGFLKVVAKNVAYDYFRLAVAQRKSSAPEKEYVALEGHFSRQGKTTEIGRFLAAVERNVSIQEIDRLLQMNSQTPTFERDYKIFWLYYRDGLTAQAISGLPGMGLSSRRVESVLHRMTRQIRAALVVSKNKNRKGPE